MKVNFLNTGNYEIYRRNDPAGKSSDTAIIVNNPQSKNRKNKDILEGKILNAESVDIKEELNPHYHHSAPVSETPETFNTVMEVIRNNPASYREVINPDKWLLPATGQNGVDSETENVAENYILSVYSDSGKKADNNLKRLKAQQILFEKYNRGNWRAPGMLVNLSF